jgi:hypothetical protein
VLVLFPAPLNDAKKLELVAELGGTKIQEYNSSPVQVGNGLSTDVVSVLIVNVAECCIAPSEPRQAGEFLSSGSKIQDGRGVSCVGTEMVTGKVPRMTVALLWMGVGRMERVSGWSLSENGVGVRG